MDIEIKRLSIETIHEQVELFNLVFGLKATEETWKHKHYFDPSLGRSDVFGALVNHQLVGMNSFIPAQYEYAGTKYMAMQSCDTVVDPNFRGRGIFSKIIQYAEAYYKKLDVDVLIGFPNHNSYPGFIKLGWVSIGNSNKLYLLSRLRGFLKWKTGLNFPGFVNFATELLWLKVRWNQCKARGYHLEQVNELSEHVLENPFANNQKLLKYVLSSEQLAWKIYRQSAGYYVVRHQDRIVSAYIVETLVTSDNLVRTYILSHYALTDDTRQLSLAMSVLLSKLKGNSDLIILKEPHISHILKFYQGIGFRTLAREGGPSFIIKTLTEDKTKTTILLDEALWNLSMIESDITINLDTE